MATVHLGTAVPLVPDTFDSSGPETQWRFRTSFFPFTEPSAEVDLLLADKAGNES